MTGTVGILLAVVAGLLVYDRRRMVVVVVVPYLVVTAIQTWGISSGRAVSPPSTVNRFPDLVGYYVVQLLILAVTLAVAFEIRALWGTPDDRGRRSTIALVVNGTLSALVVAGYLADRTLFEHGSVVRHTSEGHPPLLGYVGIVLLVVVCVALGAVLLARRRPAALRRSETG